MLNTSACAPALDAVCRAHGAGLPAGAPAARPRHASHRLPAAHVRPDGSHLPGAGICPAARPLPPQRAGWLCVWWVAGVVLSGVVWAMLLPCMPCVDMLEAALSSAGTLPLSFAPPNSCPPFLACVLCCRRRALEPVPLPHQRAVWAGALCRQAHRMAARFRVVPVHVPACQGGWEPPPCDVDGVADPRE